MAAIKGSPVMPHFSFLMGGIFVPFPSLEALHARKPWDQRYSPPIKKESFPFYAYSRPLSCLLASPFPSRKGKEEAKGEDKIDERPISVTGKACLPDTDNKNKRAMKRIPRWLIRLSYYLLSSWANTSLIFISHFSCGRVLTSQTCHLKERVNAENEGHVWLVKTPQDRKCVKIRDGPLR